MKKIETISLLPSLPLFQLSLFSQRLSSKADANVELFPNYHNSSPKKSHPMKTEICTQFCTKLNSPNFNSYTIHISISNPEYYAMQQTKFFSSFSTHFYAGIYPSDFYL